VWCVAFQFVDLFLEVGTLVFEVEDVGHVVDDVRDAEVIEGSSLELQVLVDSLLVLKAK
jgi:hypothetical protein